MLDQTVTAFLFKLLILIHPSLCRITKIFWNLRSNWMTSENIRLKLSRDLKKKLVSKSLVKYRAIPTKRRNFKTLSNLIEKLNGQQTKEPSKKKSVKVKYFCSFNLETGRVCKQEKPVSRHLLGQQNRKRTLRWGK